MPDEAMPAGVEPWAPDWKRGSCLGCDGRVVRVRDSWVEVGGTADRTYLIMWGDDPVFARSTDPDRVLTEELYLLGVAHQACTQMAISRLEAGTARLPTELLVLQVAQGAAIPMPEHKLTLNRPPQVDACPFCGATDALTDEHVWPEWFSRELHKNGMAPAGANVRGRKIDVTVPVCETCNNTWMSVLENDVSPLLRDLMFGEYDEVDPLVILPADQLRLATWATMKAYQIDALERPAVPRGFLHELALRRIPNESTVVWIGRYAPDTAAQAAKRSFDFLTPNGPTKNSPNAFMVTFTVFNVLFQVLGHFNGGLATINGSREQYDGALAPIWPPCRAGLPWPPLFSFSSASWESLTTSISDGTAS